MGGGSVAEKKISAPNIKGFTLAEVAEPRQHIRHWSKAFTLAEVLITLGIIGIVAAMTIPTLISSYNKKIVETNLVKFYSSINNAIALSEIDNGGVTTWEAYPETAEGKKNWFEKYIASYLKIADYEFSGDNNIIIKFNTGGALYIPGTSMDWQYYPRFSGTLGGQAGKDLFYFNYAPNGDSSSPDQEINTVYLKGKAVTPYKYSWDGELDTLLKNCAGTGSVSWVGAGAYCTALIEYNSWKIPDNYPIKF